jgi:phenylalanyl-tRNA synthetase beta chain
VVARVLQPPADTQQLADLLTMSGMEVEELRPVAPPFTGVVVAEILTAEPHPQADRCACAGRRRRGGGRCRSSAARPMPRRHPVPLAIVGAELPPGADGKPFTIGVGKLRGVESHGMLCSARELKLADDHGGLLELAPMRPWAPTSALAEARRHASSRSSSRPTWRHASACTASRARSRR